MRILLVGEFSGLHRELKKGLVELGHEVTLMAAGDGWKAYDCDVRIPGGNTLASKAKAAISQCALIRSMRGFDVVQFIFPHIFNRLVNSCFINQLISQNNRSFLVAAGSDAFYWKDYSSKFRYSPHCDNLVIDHGAKKKEGMAPWLTRWNHEMALKMNAIIPVAYDYRIGYSEFANLAPTIPMPIWLQDIKPQYSDPSSEQIKILYGISRPGFKGSRFIEPALDRISEKYGDQVQILRPQRVPFSSYLVLLAKADIVVDQALSYSYGMNALLSCALGKVTLSGAEPECVAELGQSRCPIINILPSIDDIYSKLDWLIAHRECMATLSQESRAYVERVHDAKAVAERYVSVWDTYHCP